MSSKSLSVKKIWSFLWLLILIGGTYYISSFFSNTITDRIPLLKQKNSKPENCEMVSSGTFSLSDTNFYVDSFWMYKTEITINEYYQITNKNPTKEENTSLLPVNFVSWYDCVNFCNLKSELDGLEPVYTIDGKSVTADFTKNGWRLPTKAEWYWAATGAINPRIVNYSGSDNIDDVAWYIKNSNGTAHECATKVPNQLGLYDMTGNVAEWCWDYYWDWNANTLPSFEQNYRGPDGKDSIKRAICGGYFGNSAKTSVLSVYQDLCGPTGTFENYGFRIARNYTEE